VAHQQAEKRQHSLLQSVQPSTGTHPIACSVDDGNFFPRVKRAGCAADHSPHVVLKLRLRGFVTPLSPLLSCRALGKIFLLDFPYLGAETLSLKKEIKAAT